MLTYQAITGRKCTIMKITVFKKQVQAKNGNKFGVYSTKLQKKDGTEQYAVVRFLNDVTKPEEYPAIISVNKSDANLSRKEYTNTDTGEIGYNYTLWVSAYTPTGEKYIDHSLDDFVD